MKGRTKRKNLAESLALALVAAMVLMAPAFAQQTGPPSTPPPEATPNTDPQALPDEDSTESLFPHFKSSRVWLTGQANFIFQTHPDFRALYSGPHSLGPQYE